MRYEQAQDLPPQEFKRLFGVKRPTFEVMVEVMQQHNSLKKKDSGNSKLVLEDQVPVAVDISYILPELGKAFAKDLRCRMTFPTLEQNGVVIERIEATLECTHASHELSESLNVPLGSPLLVYCYTAYTIDNKPIVCGQAPSRGDRLCYSVVLTNNSAIRDTSE